MYPHETNEQKSMALVFLKLMFYLFDTAPEVSHIC